MPFSIVPVAANVAQHPSAERTDGRDARSTVAGDAALALAT
ncbi:MAG TPA: hypothetical protein VER17_20895 [Tepidisphaeraceae bacterium]|nr:hypothetical protein [Tepidisphaeraceae bacterium]